MKPNRIYMTLFDNRAWFRLESWFARTRIAVCEPQDGPQTVSPLIPPGAAWFSFIGRLARRSSVPGNHYLHIWKSYSGSMGCLLSSSAP